MTPGPEDGSSQSVEDFVGNAFGDFSAESEPVASDPASAAGAPPAEHAPDAAAPPSPEGTEPVTEPAGTPPAAAPVAAPDAVPEADPLVDAKPATYTVNGESRTYDGIKVLGADGAIIAAADLPDVLRKLGERDHYFETNRAQYGQLQSLERLSEWQTRGADGTEQTLRGAEGLQAMRVSFATLNAAFDTLTGIFKDPAKFAALVDVDGEGKIVPNRTALTHLLTEADLAEERAEKATRATLQTLSAPPAPTGPPDYSKAAPGVITQAAGTLDAHLTPEDRALLASQMQRYVRPVTEADRQGNPMLKLGSAIVDASFKDVVAALANVRAQAKATATATTTAAATNAAKLAAAARGKPATPPAPRTPAKPAPDARASDADQGYALIENLMSGKRPAAA